MSRAQSRELPAHLEEIKSFAVRLPFQMKLSRVVCGERSRRTEYDVGTTTERVDDRGNARLCGA